MYMLGSRIGYVLATSSNDGGDSFGIRFTGTVLDYCFPARYSAPLHSVAYWIRESVGNPQRGQLFASIYEDNGSYDNPGTPLETISAGTGTYGFGRLEITGFTVSLVKGRRYRLRLTTTNTSNNNFGEFSLGPTIDNKNEFNSTTYLGYSVTWRWNNSWVVGRRFNVQVFQTVNNTPVSDHVLLRYDVGRNWGTSYTISSSTGPTGFRWTVPEGGKFRFFAVSLGFLSIPNDITGRQIRLLVMRDGKVVGCSFAQTFAPGIPLFRFGPAIVLEGGATYDFVFDQMNPGYSFSIRSRWVDPTYIPSWMPGLIYNGNVVSDEVWNILQLFLDDFEPVHHSCIINPYVMMPVG